MNSDIEEKDIDKMLENELDYQREIERMTPAQRYFQALKMQRLALQGMLDALDRFFEQEKRIKEKL